MTPAAELASILGPYDLGVAVLVLIGFVIIVAFGRTIRAEVRGMKVTVDGIDRAVNRKPAGEPTLYELAKAAQLAADEALVLGHRTAAKVEEVGQLVTAHLAHHQADADAAAAGR